MGGQAEPVFDQAKISMLRSFLDEEDLHLGLIDLCDESLESLSRIEQGLVSGDVEEIRRAAHSLKGMAGNFGARRLSALAEWVELESWDRPTLAARLPELAEIIETTRARATEVCGGPAGLRLDDPI